MLIVSIFPKTVLHLTSIPPEIIRKPPLKGHIYLNKPAAIVQSILDDLIRKILTSAKLFVHTLKAYMIVYITAKFLDSSFSQSHVG